MNNTFRRFTSLLMALALLLSVLPAAAAAENEPEQTVYFSALHATNAALSSMDSYFEKPASVQFIDDELFVSFVVTSSSNIALTVKLDPQGELEDTSVLSTDIEANTRVVQFPIDNLNAVIEAQVVLDMPHIIDPRTNQPYRATHAIRLAFNVGDASVLKTLVTSAQSAHNNAVIGVDDGEYLAFSKAIFQAAINEAKVVSANVFATQEQLDEAQLALEDAIQAFESAEIGADNNTAIHYSAIMAGSSTLSSMDKYFKKYALVKEVDGKHLVSFLVTDSNIITSFKVEVDEELTETSVVFEDLSNNTRVVEFPVDDLGELLPAQVTIDMPDVIDPRTNQPYHATHGIRLAFNTANPTELNSLVAAAQAFHNSAVVGSNEGKYDQEDKTALQAAINAAKAIGNNGLAEQSQMDSTATTLEEALYAFYAEKNWSNGNYPINRTSVGSNFEQLVTSGSVILDDDSNKLRLALAANTSVKSLENVTDSETIEAGSTTAQYIEFPIDNLTAVYELELAITNGENEMLHNFTFRLAAVTGVIEAVVPPVTDPGTNPGGVTDGQYSLSYRILQSGTNTTSIMDSYVAHPGRLLVQDGKKYVQIQLKQSKEIVSFAVGGVETSTIESNSASNTRRVQFEVTDIPAKISGNVKIHWPEFNYNNMEHSVDIQLISATPVSNWGSESFGPPPTFPNQDAEEEEEEEEEEDIEEGSVEETNGSGNTTNPGSTNIVFKDTSSHWASKAIERAVQLKIVNGYADGEFKPNASVKRSEWTAILGRALKLEGQSKPLTFTDADSFPAWARSYIEQAYSAGIINGFEDGSFQPNKDITRAEMAVMIVRALNLPLEDASTLTFDDADQIPAFAKAYIATAVKHGLLNGIGNNLFGASQTATRAEAVTVALRAVDYAAASEAE